MARRNMEGSRISTCVLAESNTQEFVQLTLGGTLTMQDGGPNVMLLDANGAGRTVLLPPERKGLFYEIYNLTASTYALTVKEDSNTTTIGSIAAAKSAKFFCDGTTWRLFAGA